MQQNPKISVIIPCFNQGRYLPDALQSILEQSYADWECIIINDGATDNTHKVSKEWMRKDSRFQYIKQQNSGLSSARNAGLNLATGEYIQFLDADDKLHPEKFSASLKVPGDTDIILCNFLLFSKVDANFTSPSFCLSEVIFSFKEILLGWDDRFVIPIHCGLLRRGLFQSTRFLESLKAKEDWLMWLQVYQQPVKTVFVNRPYAYYRRSAQNMSENRRHMHSNLVLAYKEIFKILAPEYQEDFFFKTVNSLGCLLEESDRLFEKTRQSKSYRLGNFFIRNFSKLNPPIR